MTRFNPTRIANRIGRIVFATILAGLFITVAQIPGSVRDGTLPSLTNPISVYGDVLFELVFITVAASFVVPVVMVGLWGLSRRYSRTRIWQAFASLGVVIAVGNAFIEGGGDPLEIVLSMLTMSVYAACTLGAVALIEYFYASGVASDITAGEFTTASGGVIAAVGMAVFLVAASSTGVLAVADLTGVSIDSSNGEYGATDDELRSEYSHLFAAETGDDLRCGDSPPIERTNMAPASETYDHNLSEMEVDAQIKETYAGSDIVLEFSHTDGYHIQSYTEWSVRDGTVSVDGQGMERQANSQSVNITAIHGDYEHSTIHDGSMDGMYVQFDVVNDDGKLIRYSGVLCDA